MKPSEATFSTEVRQNLSGEVTLVTRTQEGKGAGSPGESWGRWRSKSKGPGAGISEGRVRNGDGPRGSDAVSRGDRRGRQLAHPGPRGLRREAWVFSSGTTRREMTRSALRFQMSGNEAVERSEPSRTAGGKVKRCGHRGGQLGGCSKVKHRLSQ